MYNITVVDGFLLLLVSCHVLCCHVEVFLNTNNLVDNSQKKVKKRK